MSAEFYEDEKATAEEKDISSKRAFGQLLPLLKEHTKGLLFCLGLLAGATLLSLYWPILMKTAVDTDIKDGDFDGLLMTALAIAGIQVATILFQLSRALVAIHSAAFSGVLHTGCQERGSRRPSPVAPQPAARWCTGEGRGGSPERRKTKITPRVFTFQRSGVPRF